MNILSKSFVTGALAAVVTAAAFTTALSTPSEAGRKAHFRHAIRHCHNASPHPYRCMNRVYHRAYNHAHAARYGFGYVSGYYVANACGWEVITIKKWNPAHTRLTVIKDRVWNCY